MFLKETVRYQVFVVGIFVSLFRFGSFEIFKATDPMAGRCGPSVGREDILVQLLDHAIQSCYPQVGNKKGHFHTGDDPFRKINTSPDINLPITRAGPYIKACFDCSSGGCCQLSRHMKGSRVDNHVG